MTHAAIADVRDVCRIEKICDLYRSGVVFHVAACKYAPHVGANPEEPLTNSVFGACNVEQAARTYKVKRFVRISTDGDVNRAQLIGMDKQVAIGPHGRANVLGSRGSAVPLFCEQILERGSVI